MIVVASVTLIVALATIFLFLMLLPKNSIIIFDILLFEF